jgi:hypothetical protein
MLMIAGLCPAPALASPADAIAAFDGHCVATGASLPVIERMALASKARPVPKEVVDQDPAAARFGGKGFGFLTGSIRFVVIATERNTCAVVLIGEDPSAITAIVERTYPLAKPHVETAGPQVTRMYRLLQPSVLAGGYLSVTVPKPGFGADGLVSIGYIPAEAAEALRAKR